MASGTAAEAGSLVDGPVVGRISIDATSDESSRRGALSSPPPRHSATLAACSNGSESTTPPPLNSDTTRRSTAGVDDANMYRGRRPPSTLNTAPRSTGCPRRRQDRPRLGTGRGRRRLNCGVRQRRSSGAPSKSQRISADDTGLHPLRRPLRRRGHRRRPHARRADTTNSANAASTTAPHSPSPPSAASAVTPDSRCTSNDGLPLGIEAQTRQPSEQTRCAPGKRRDRWLRPPGLLPDPLRGHPPTSYWADGGPPTSTTSSSSAPDTTGSFLHHVAIDIHKIDGQPWSPAPDGNPVRRPPDHHPAPPPTTTP